MSLPIIKLLKSIPVLCVCFAWVWIAAPLEAQAAPPFGVLPEQVELTGHQASANLIVQQKEGEEFQRQLVEGNSWSSEDGSVVTVNSQGQIQPTGNGKTVIVLKREGSEVKVPVSVSGFDQNQAPSFRHDVLPILSKVTCNSGACHGALAGKGGFRLSLRGYDPASDHFNIAHRDRGRRIEFADPGRSLMLAKPSGIMPHKGGVRYEPDSPEFQLIADWIAAGAPEPSESDPAVNGVEIYPSRSLHTVGEHQQMVVRARFSNGEERDVTSRVIWSSANEAVCTVDEEGNVEIVGHGEGAIVAWYSSQLAIARITVPFPQVEQASTELKPDDRKPRNFIDEQIDRQLQRLNLPASPGCDDGTFVRRAYLDTIGRLPNTEETISFLSNASPTKRDELIETLLSSSDFVDYWSYQWSDVLMLNGTLLRPTPLKAYYDWLHGHLEKNTPWDEMVREIITATGRSDQNGATNFYALNQTPEDMTENASQAFLGLSIGCAKCHNHPLEKWTNDQYYGMANLFARVRAKGWGGESRNGDGIRTLYVTEEGDLVQPRTGKPQPPTPLDAESLAMDAPEDRRLTLAEWLTSPENPYFARSITNRVWARFFGVGLVETVDDMRVSNPASNDELLTAASDYLVTEKFNLKSLMRQILQSNAYQRSSKSLPGNAEEHRFYSRYYPRRLMAEVLHDAIVQVTSVPTKFEFIAFPGADKQKTDFYPEGTRAVQLYDSAVENYFLSTFGRNPRNIVCECERSAEPSTVQVLHISNGSTVNDKLKSKDCAVERLLTLRQNGMADAAVVDQIYLSALSRYPTNSERERLIQMLPETGTNEERLVLEDLFWAILSSKEFLFNH